MDTELKSVCVDNVEKVKETILEIPECQVHMPSNKNKSRHKRSNLQYVKKEFYKDVAGIHQVTDEKDKAKSKCSSHFGKKVSKAESPFGKQKYWVYFERNRVPPTGAPIEYDPSTRNDFVRYVFTLLFIMLAVTALFVIIVWNVEFLHDIFSDRALHFFILIPAMYVTIVIFVMGYVFTCSECSRQVPCNYICLVIVVLGFSVILSVITLKYDVKHIAIASVTNAVVVGLCLGLACTSFDFTKFYLYFVVISLAVSILGLGVFMSMKILGWKSKPMVLVILFLYVIVTMIGLVMELQMILGGRTIEIGEEDYALAAYMLYSSIIEMFMHLLHIIGILDT